MPSFDLVSFYYILRCLFIADTRPAETIEISDLSGRQIWERIEAVAGGAAQSAVESPKAAAPKAAAASA